MNQQARLDVAREFRKGFAHAAVGKQSKERQDCHWYAGYEAGKTAAVTAIDAYLSRHGLGLGAEMLTLIDGPADSIGPKAEA